MYSLFIPSKYSYPLDNSASEGLSSTDPSSSSSSSVAFFASLGNKSYPRSFKSLSNSLRFLLLTTSSPLQTSSTKRALLSKTVSSLLIFSRSMALRFK